jgi:putative ABC transport system permease protein
VASVRGVLRSIDPTVPVYEITTGEAMLDGSMGPRRFTMFLLACFASLALLLACIGLFGLMAYLVSQRVHDIGVRLALGARPAEVFRLVVGRGLLLSLARVLFGLVGALRLAPMLETLLFGVAPVDPLTFLGAALLMLVVAFLACWVPAWRAMRVDPLVALRYE